jgi:Ca2+-binding RTX toxin-like protein
MRGGHGNDTLNGGDGDDVLTGNTLTFSNRITGLIVGGSGYFSANDDGDTDILDGAQGNDSLYGEWGNDTLIGGAGDDFLSGGNSVFRQSQRSTMV